MMKSKLFPVIFILLTLSSCKDGYVIDQEYHAELYFVNKTTKEPYFTEFNKDSLRIYEKENSVLVPFYSGGYINQQKKNAYVINAISLIGREKLILYIYINQYDTDTLAINNQINFSNKKNQVDRYLTTAFYNGRQLKQVSSDTTSIVSLEIFK